MLISDGYRELNTNLHKNNMNYGMSGMNYANEIFYLCEEIGTQDILDYGCGKDTLARNLPFDINRYDPAIERFSKSPEPADFVACTDVLEHIEPENLHDVLMDLRRVTKKMGYFVIHTGPARKTLDDGRNAHLIIQDYAWWYRKVSQYFEIIKSKNGHSVTFYVKPKEEVDTDIYTLTPHTI